MNVDPAASKKSKLAYNLEEAAAATGYSVSPLRIAIRRHDLLARYANAEPIILADELQDWLRSLPTEPKGGHRPLSQYAEEVEGCPSPREEGQRTPPPPANALFRTPEEVAPELGISKSALRNYYKVSGIHTRLGKNRIMLHEDEIPRLVEWILARRDKAEEWWTDADPAPFA